MSFNANAFLASPDFTNSVTGIVEAKTYNWSAPCFSHGLCKPASGATVQLDALWSYGLRSSVHADAGSPTSMLPSCSVRASIRACMH